MLRLFKILLCGILSGVWAYLFWTYIPNNPFLSSVLTATCAFITFMMLDFLEKIVQKDK